MQKSSQFVLTMFLAAGVLFRPVASWGQTQDPASAPQTSPSTTTQTSQPAKPQETQTTTQSTQGKCQDTTATQAAPDKTQDPKVAQPAAPCAAAKPAPGTPGADAPVPQQQTVHPKNSNEDVEAIGNRNPGKGINFYSIEHEIALGQFRAARIHPHKDVQDSAVGVGLRHAIEFFYPEVFVMAQDRL